MTTSEEGIEVRDADEILVILGGGTDYDAYNTSYVSNTAALASTIQARINDASAKSWSELYSEHLADFQQFFSRVEFQLEGTKNEQPTNKLIDNYNGGKGTDALMLERLYFAYGRYLEICSSRGVDVPSNLQGIWNNMASPSWNADIHANINVQMNYWPAETTNLSEMHVPFLNYIWNMAENHSEWKSNVTNVVGQSRGWTCFTENNIFGGGTKFASYYVVANAWYCTTCGSTTAIRSTKTTSRRYSPPCSRPLSSGWIASSLPPTARMKPPTNGRPNKAPRRTV